MWWRKGGEPKAGTSTSDYWTENNNETHTTTSFHYIRSWKLHSLTLDFIVHEGTTTGEAVFEDVADVLCMNDPEQKPFCFYSIHICITPVNDIIIIIGLLHIIIFGILSFLVLWLS